MSHLAIDTTNATTKPTPRICEARDRVFRGATARAALAAVRAALGDDALILKTYDEAGWAVVVARPAEREREHASATQELLLAPPRSTVPGSGVGEAHDVAPAPLLQLVEQGVAEHIARRVIERAARVRGVGSTGEALQAVLAELVEGAAAPWRRAADKRRRVVALLGPTGVGKTTTIAKMAARAILEGQQRVALVTLDTWRIGAVEHLRRYGEIMDVPAFVARDAASLRRVLDDVRDRELVLIDTAGRSPFETASFEEQLRTLTGCAEISLYLTVSAGTGIRQLRAIRQRYESCGALLQTLITKVDESDGAGAVLNAAAILGRPVAGITDGQRVPEDLHEFEPQSFAAQVGV